MKEKIINDPITYSKEILGIDLSNLQEIVLSEFLIKDNNYDSAAVIVGMRSTKSMLGAIFGSWMLYKFIHLENYCDKYGILPDMKVFGIFLSNSPRTGNIYDQFLHLINNSPWWQGHINNLKEKNLFELKKNSLILDKVEILNLYGDDSFAGKTSIFFVIDELSSLIENYPSIGDVYFSAERTTKPFKTFSKMLVLTTPMHKTCAGMNLLYYSNECICGQYKQIINYLRDTFTSKRITTLISFNMTSWEGNEKFNQVDFYNFKSVSNDAYWRDFVAIPSMF